jgi:hypothetical protein
MKWTLIVVGGIAALIALVAVGGLLLPRDHVAAMSARVAATPESVWATLTDPVSFPSWRRDVTKVEMLPAAATGPSWREHSSDGRITFVTDVLEPPHRMVGRIADKTLPFGGSWEYRIEPDGPSSSKVTIIERGSVYNPIFRVMSRYVFGHTATIEKFLRSLGKKYGAEPTPALVAIAGE